MLTIKYIDLPDGRRARVITGSVEVTAENGEGVVNIKVSRPIKVDLEEKLIEPKKQRRIV